MNVITYSHARNALKSVLDAVVRDVDVIINVDGD
jgi:prevent-host-death family protein